MSKFNIIILTIAFLVVLSVGGLFIADGFKNLMKLEINTAEVNIKVNEEVKPSYEYLKSITVYLTGQLENKKWVGTGTVIKIDEEYTYILTNKHVAGGGNKEATIYVENGLRQLETELVDVHSNLDLAVVKVKGKLKDKQVVKGFSTASPQDKLYLVGHFLGIRYVYSEGVFVGYDGISDIVQLPVCYGNSGSAVCDKEGNLIGVIFAIYRIGLFDVDTSHGIMVDGLSVRLFLEKLNLLWKPRTLNLGVTGIFLCVSNLTVKTEGRSVKLV